MGPFAFQVASGTHEFEYPWAYFGAGAAKGTCVLQLGGGLGGLQYVLAAEGCRVVNVDNTGPRTTITTTPWGELDVNLHNRLNEVFGTDVRLIRATLADAALAGESFDRALCLSVFDSLPLAAARDLLAEVVRLLTPGGLVLVTAGLYFDLKPFGVLRRNCFGSNLDLYRLVEGIGLDLVRGDPRELHGFPEFDRSRVAARVPDLFMSPYYPCVIQTMVLRKD